RLELPEYLPGWHAARSDGALGLAEQQAAEKAAAHAQTPGVSHFDCMGRRYLTLVDNRDETYLTRLRLDVEGLQREIVDARGRVVTRHDYDLLGRPIHLINLDSAERWLLSDIAGKPIGAWDSRGHRERTEYDALGRALRSFVQGADPEDPEREILFFQAEYGETQPGAAAQNLRGKEFRQFDSAGIATNETYDFKGNLLQSSRQLAADYRTTPDWSLTPELEADVFRSSTSYDALNRPNRMTTPDQSVIRPTYNEANLLERLDVHLRGSPVATSFVSGVAYNPKGQRRFIEYGNGIRSRYEYDPLTFRMTGLRTQRGTDHLQDLRYTYDPAGNMSAARDEAQQTLYFRNSVVEPHTDYVYDALYRLVAASGREHVGQSSPRDPRWDDAFRVNLPHPHDGQAMRRYTERYEYDPVGNILDLLHEAQNATWRRTYRYDEPSLIELQQTNNRLSSTAVGQGIEAYSHDNHGNMISMAHLPVMRWDFHDHLAATTAQVVNSGTPETTYYVCDAAGRRIRKVTDRQAVDGASPTRRRERLYLGAFEIHREYDADGSAVTLERETLHVLDGQQRIALVETRTQGDDGSSTALVRYQLGNSVNSATLELDLAGDIISYEEYYPYGSTSYQAGRNLVEVSRKRYRYTGKERDEETGMSYHGARYCAPWLGRWTSADPAGLIDGLNSYLYVRANPIAHHDPTGQYTEPADHLSDQQKAAEEQKLLNDQALRSERGQADPRQLFASPGASEGAAVGDANAVVAPPATTEEKAKTPPKVLFLRFSNQEQGGFWDTLIRKFGKASITELKNKPSRRQVLKLLRESDVVVISGHHWVEAGGDPGEFENKTGTRGVNLTEVSKLTREPLSEKTKVIFVTGCNTCRPRSLDFLREEFPNATIIGWGTVSQTRSQWAMTEKFAKHLEVGSAEEIDLQARKAWLLAMKEMIDEYNSGTGVPRSKLRVAFGMLPSMFAPADPRLASPALFSQVEKISKSEYGVATTTDIPSWRD
ncbi:MAG: RHS repeat-associated core domain-containing protein, partial [Steroidobacteraceae bacterium]